MPNPRAYIIHGYQSFPEEAWLPWLKTELEKQGYAVALPAMPKPDAPVIAEWIAFIAKLVGEPDHKTVLVGHSLGVQAVIRYLETLGYAGDSVRKTLLVAGSFPPGLALKAAKERIHGNEILLPWFTSTVNGAMVRKAAGKCTVILSQDDPYIPVAKAVAAFRQHLNPTFVIENGKGHYNEDDKITQLPAALKAIIA